MWYSTSFPIISLCLYYFFCVCSQKCLNLVRSVWLFTYTNSSHTHTHTKASSFNFWEQQSFIDTIFIWTENFLSGTMMFVEITSLGRWTLIKQWMNSMIYSITTLDQTKNWTYHNTRIFLFAASPSHSCLILSL